MMKITNISDLFAAYALSIDQANGIKGGFFDIQVPQGLVVPGGDPPPPPPPPFLCGPH